VKNKAILAISVGCKAGQLGREVDDSDSVKRAFFNTDSAANTEVFRDSGDLGGFVDLDAEFADAIDRAVFLAFLTAFVGFAFVRIDESDTSFVIHRELKGFEFEKFRK